VTAIALGLAMVTTESLATSWLYRREREWHLLRGLTKAAAGILGLYLVIRLGDLALRGQLHYLVDGSWASGLFVAELLASAVIPMLLFLLPSTRSRPGLLTTGALLAVAGFVFHRANVGGIAHVPVTGQPYFPSLVEIFVSLGVVSTLGLIFLFFLERFPIWKERPAVAEHFTPPMQDPTTRTYFGGPWFSGAHLAAVAWIGGALLGLLLLEVSATDGAPEPRPVRAARAVWMEKSVRPNGPGNHFQMTATGEHPALLIDGDRAGTFVLFEHKAHQARLGNRASCVKCHHANLPLEGGTPCSTCHQDMYRATDTYSHAHHVAALGGNRSCARCHPDATTAKTREASTSCASCHQAEIVPEERTLVRFDNELPPGLAPGYRAAMHGLCIRCHVSHETREAAQEPYLGRCTACHRGHSPAGEELRLREGRTLNARLELP
jgi:hypothetical protein